MTRILTNSLSNDELSCQAWENKTCSVSFVLHIEKDAQGNVIKKSKGAYQKHVGPNHYLDAVAAVNQAVANAVNTGWRRGTRFTPRPRTQNQYQSRPSPSGRGYAPNPPPPRPSSWSGGAPPPKPVVDPMDKKCAFVDIDAAARAIVDAGFKTLAKVHHPDLGGAAATMSILTESRRQLRQMLDLVKES